MRRTPGELGRRAARQFLTRELRPTARQIAARLGIEVVEREAPPPAQPGLRSEYQADPPRIVLYRSSLEAVAARQGRAAFLADAVEAHIAHEIFHHLEFGGKLGPLGREETEEAAHGFTQELLGLGYDPGALARAESESE